MEWVRENLLVGNKRVCRLHPKFNPPSIGMKVYTIYGCVGWIQTISEPSYYKPYLHVNFPEEMNPVQYDWWGHELLLSSRSYEDKISLYEIENFRRAKFFTPRRMLRLK